DPGYRNSSCGEAGAECAAAEVRLELQATIVCGVGGEVDRGQVGAAWDREDTDEDRGRVQPAREEVAGGVAHWDAVGRDAADRGAECKRGHDRGQGEGGV